jgi:thioredoxin-related protein
MFYSKRTVSIFFSFFTFCLGFSQGISFVHSKWGEAIEKAKITNKLIFVDVYTNWCGPCKKMNKEIFTLETVGKVYNSNFICYQINAENNEGKILASQFNVSVYPTFLFIKADGSLVYRWQGYLDADKFISLSDSVFSVLYNSKSIEKWDKEYTQNNADTTFLKEYINKRDQFGLSNLFLFNEYLQLLPLESRYSDFIVKLYLKEGVNLKINTVAYDNLLNNYRKLYDKLFNSVYSYMFKGVMNSIKEAALLKDTLLLKASIIAYDQLPVPAKLKQKEELYMQYYKMSGNKDMYLKCVISFCNYYLMKTDIDSLTKVDSANFMLFQKSVRPEVINVLDTNQIANMQESIKHAERNKISQKLNNYAWYVFEKVSDKSTLELALGWSKRSLEIFPFNPQSLDTYANLLYKLGFVKEAILKEEEALKYTTANDRDYNVFMENIRKMKVSEGNINR